MPADLILRLKIESEGSGKASTTIDKTSDSIDKAGNAANKAAQKMKGAQAANVSLVASFFNIAKGAAAASLGFLSVQGAINTVRNTLRESLIQFRDQEAASTKLAIALGSFGKFSGKAVRELEAFADSLQTTTKFGNTAIQMTEALLAQLGRLDKEGIKRATKAAIDMAVVLQRDLRTATLIVAKAAQGNTSELANYGIILDNTIPKQEKFASFLRLIESRFGGTAALAVNTYSGSIDGLKNSWADFLKVIGQTGTFFRPLIDGLSVVFTELNRRFLQIDISTLDAVEATQKFKKELDGLRDIQEELAAIEQRRATTNPARSAGITADVPRLTRKLQSQLQTLEKELPDLEAPIRFTIARGSKATIEEFFTLFNEAATQAAEAGATTLEKKLLELRELAERQLETRVQLDAEAAVTQVKNLRTLLETAGQTPIEIELFTPEIESTVRTIERLTGKEQLIDLGVKFDNANFDILQYLDDLDGKEIEPRFKLPDLRVLVQGESRDDFFKRIKENVAEAEEIAKVQATLEANFEDIPVEKLVEFGETLFTIFRDKSKEGIEDGVEESLQTANRLIPLLRAFRDVREQRAIIETDQKAIDFLDAVERKVSAINDQINNVTFRNLRSDSESLDEAIERARNSMAQFAQAASTTDVAAFLTDTLERLDQLSQDLPKRRKEIQEFKDEIREEVTFIINARVDANAVKNEAQLLGRTVEALQRQSGASPLDIFETRELVRLQDLDALRERLVGITEQMTAMNRSAANLQLSDFIAQEAEKMGTDIDRFGIESVIAFARARAAAEDAAKGMSEFDKAISAIDAQFKVAVSLDDKDALEQARISAELLKVAYPDVIEIDVLIKSINDRIDSDKKKVESLRDKIEGITFRNAEDAFSNMVSSMTSEADRLETQMGQTFRAIADAAIRELARIVVGDHLSKFLGRIPAVGQFFQAGGGEGDGGEGNRLKPNIPQPPAGDGSSPISVPASGPVRAADDFLAAIDRLQATIQPPVSTVRVEPISENILSRIAPLFERDTREQTFNIRAIDGASIRRQLRTGDLGREIYTAQKQSLRGF